MCLSLLLNRSVIIAPFFIYFGSCNIEQSDTRRCSINARRMNRTHISNSVLMCAVFHGWTEATVLAEGKDGRGSGPPDTYYQVPSCQALSMILWTQGCFF